MSAPTRTRSPGPTPQPRRRRPAGGWPFYGCRYQNLGSVDKGGCQGVWNQWSDDGDPANRGLQHFVNLHPDPDVREGMASNYKGFMTEQEAQDYSETPQVLFPEKVSRIT